MKVTYTTNDGQTFDNKADAKAHEKEQKAMAKTHATSQGLTNFLTARLPQLGPDEVDAIVAAVLADPAAFRDAVVPLLRGARKPRADAGRPRGRLTRTQAVAAA